MNAEAVPAAPSEGETIAERLERLRGHTLASRLALIFVLALMGALGFADSVADDDPGAVATTRTVMRVVPFAGALMLWAVLLIEQAQDNAACRAGADAARRHFDARLARALVSVGWMRLSWLALAVAVALLLFVNALHYTGRLAGWKAMCPALIAGVLVWEIVERRLRVRPELLELAQETDVGETE